MHVLEHAARIVGYVEAEVVVHLSVPALRQILQLDATVDDVLLELEANLADVHDAKHVGKPALTFDLKVPRPRGGIKANPCAATCRKPAGPAAVVVALSRFHEP